MPHAAHPHSLTGSLPRPLLLPSAQMRPTTRVVRGGSAAALVAHQSNFGFARSGIPSLLAVHGYAVPQLRFSLVVALEVNFIERVMRVMNDLEEGELIRPLRLHLACLARGGIETGLGAIEGHRLEIAERMTNRCAGRCCSGLCVRLVRASSGRGLILRSSYIHRSCER